jgi:hypothetical protein
MFKYLFIQLPCLKHLLAHLLAFMELCFKLSPLFSLKNRGLSLSQPLLLLGWSVI